MPADASSALNTGSLNAGPMRLAVFASGGGTNFQALLDAIAEERLPADAALLVTNRADAGAVRRAERHGVPVAVLDPSQHDRSSVYTEALLDALRGHRVSFIALAGYLRKIPTPVVEGFRGRMLNVHPSLLPAFGGKGMYGLHVHRAVLDYGARWTGATVHLVDEAYDTGPVVLQEPVPVRPGDSPETLAARVLKVEHQLFPEALRLFAEGRARLDGRHVRLLTPDDAS